MTTLPEPPFAVHMFGSGTPTAARWEQEIRFGRSDHRLGHCRHRLHGAVGCSLLPACGIFLAV